MVAELVRICPVCETENPPALARCRCGASLVGVDFSLPRPPPEPVATQAPAAAEGAPTHREAAAAAVAATTASVVCPHADCGQPNPPDATRCLYCNRPLAPTPAAASARPLPAALRERYRVLDVFAASGSEADLMLVELLETRERRVAKLYRKGLEPDFELIARLARTVGNAVVRVLEHGVSDGVAYEILEYVPHGTLKELLQSGPLTREDVRRIVEEIAEALDGIHAEHILHRDLKPENVLLRSISPVELALTDFGIASLATATQHFTSAARTTRYAAPEALTGVIDDKSDWWSLGMIVLEAATGRHPFEGLTEQVISHHLATKPIDVRDVFDDDLRRLCRGLLLRDPKRRWGGREVARWLAGDPTLQPPESDEAPLVVRPYRIGTTESTNARELAVAMARHWDDARKDVARGQVRPWIEHELHDDNLLRVLHDVREQRDLSDDARLLRFMLAAAPDLPPVWQGAPVSRDALVAAAQRALDGDDAARRWLHSIAREDVLAQFAAAGHAELVEFDRAWDTAWQRCLAFYALATRVEERWRKRPRPLAGSDETVTSIDDLMFGAVGRMGAPDRSMLDPRIVLALDDARYVDGLRDHVLRALAELEGDCAWFDELWQQAHAEAAGVIVAAELLPHAQDDAEQERRRDASSRVARTRAREEARRALRERLREVLALVPDRDEPLSDEAAARLAETLDATTQACRSVAANDYGAPDSEAVRRAADRLVQLALKIQEALAEQRKVQALRAIVLRPERVIVGIALAGLVVVFARRVPWLLLVLLVLGIAAAAYWWQSGFAATEGVLKALKAFRVHALTLLRTTLAQDGSEDGARPS